MNRDKKRIYAALATLTKRKHKTTLNKLAKNAKPSFGFYTTIAHIFGISFALRRLSHRFSITKQEKKLLETIKEERVRYAGSIVLGLNDALIELTGALTGFTFALKEGKIIALIGFITGVAASLSMAASAYLSTKENNPKRAIKSAWYTGIAYFIVVFLLVSPYLLLPPLIALWVMLLIAISIIAFYSFYIATVKSTSFRHRFLEMLMISGSVALISFGLGSFLKNWFGI